jgi:hypothetical protein
MLSAPEAPAPTAIARSAIAAMTGWIVARRRDAMPTRAVKTTSDITRGFSSAKIVPTVPAAPPGQPQLR